MILKSKFTSLATSLGGGCAVLRSQYILALLVPTFLLDVGQWIQFLIVSSSLSVVIYSPHLVLAVRNRLWNNAGFFLLIWAVHYIPFFLMNRQLFVHHYLPSHVASALIAGAVLNFVLSETINYPISIRGPKMKKARTSQYSDIGLKGPVILFIFGIIMFFMFIFIAPLTYGTPG
jgi:dolichyl-phosphate-mannose--protein O-mannosyl transferase